jgi:hypothetical protein
LVGGGDGAGAERRGDHDVLDPAGVVARISVGLITATSFAWTPPTVTCGWPEKLVPVMVITVPPCVGPVFGDTAATVGGDPV